MDVKEIKQLLDAVAKAEISELTLETGDTRLTVKRGGGEAPTVVTAPAAPVPEANGPAVPPSAPAQSHATPTPTPEPKAPEPAAPAPSRLAEVTAPIVGTFYASPSPDTDAYVKVGDRVKPGTVLCIIEAMKLMNEIEAETAGTISEVLVRNEEPVEYGQVLFRIDPD